MELIEAVKQQIKYLKRSHIINFGYRKELFKKSITKENAIEILANTWTQELAEEFIDKYQDIIGFSGYALEKLLNISTDARIYLTKKGRLRVTGKVQSRINQKIVYSLYDIRQVVALSQDDTWRLELPESLAVKSDEKELMDQLAGKCFGEHLFVTMDMLEKAGQHKEGYHEQN